MVTNEEIRIIKLDQKEMEDFIESMQGEIGFEQPDGTIKYSKLEWLG